MNNNYDARARERDNKHDELNFPPHRVNRSRRARSEFFFPAYHKSIVSKRAYDRRCYVFIAFHPTVRVEYFIEVVHANGILCLTAITKLGNDPPVVRFNCFTRGQIRPVQFISTSLRLIRKTRIRVRESQDSLCFHKTFRPALE